MIINQFLYVSESKIRSMHVRAKGASQRPSSLRASLSLPLGVSLEASTSKDAAEPPESEFDQMLRKLDLIVDYLSIHYDLSDFRGKQFQPGQWIKFDTKMSYGTLCRDDESLPDDVFFAASEETEGDSFGGGGRLLLCGSIHHLTSGVTSNGRIGSTNDWLREMVLEIDKQESRGRNSMSYSMNRIRSIQLNSDTAFSIVRDVHRIMLRDNPTGQFTRLRGYASVILDSSISIRSDRVILASPLYIEIAPVSQKSSFWPRVKRRFRTLRDLLSRIS